MSEQYHMPVRSILASERYNSYVSVSFLECWSACYDKCSHDLFFISPITPHNVTQCLSLNHKGSGPNSRTSQLFIALASSSSLGTQLWETPIGEIDEGMDVVEHFYSYGDMPPWGKGPVQQKIHSGPAYMEENFPLTDKFTTCQVQRLTTAAEREAEITDPTDDGADDTDEVPPELLEEEPQQLRHAEIIKPGFMSSSSTLPTLSAVAVIAILAVVWWWWRWILGRSQQKSSKSV